MVTGPHHQARERLNRGLWRACELGHFGASFGRDFVMRLGDNSFTPDGHLIGRQATERLFERYLHGPADLVIEVLLPGRDEQDRVVKRGFYEAGGVPEYWLVDPEAQTIDFLQLEGGGYRPQALAADGRYRPTSVPGLALVPDRLWQDSLPWDVSVFDVEIPLPGNWSYKEQKGIRWDEIPFVPQPALQPLAIAFEEFASWCPRAKMEGDGVRTTIGGQRGTRNVLGMLLRTFGLTEAVTVFHPRLWVAGLALVEDEQRNDVQRKARWWALARQVAAPLRQKHGNLRMAVIGDLTRSEPLHFWSELALVVWGLPGDTFENYELLRDLDKDGIIDLIDPEWASPAEQRAIAKGGIEVS